VAPRSLYIAPITSVLISLRNWGNLGRAARVLHGCRKVIKVRMVEIRLTGSVLKHLFIEVDAEPVRPGDKSVGASGQLLEEWFEAGELGYAQPALFGRCSKSLENQGQLINLRVAPEQWAMMHPTLQTSMPIEYDWARMNISA
jgi:hypothetical protein